MSRVHFYLAHHTPKSKAGSAARAVRYLERTGEYAHDAPSIVAYNARSGGRKKDYTDLRDSGVAHLPSWAQGDARVFFEAAEKYEGVNRRWGTSMQANFPREFTTEHQSSFTKSFVEATLPGRPLLWVIHEPTASDGLPQPHAHFLWSERLRPAGMEEAPPERMFRRPEVGGYPKYPFGQGDRQAVYRLREAWCGAINLEAERLGYGPEALMDPRSLHSRGIHRRAVRVERVVGSPEGLETKPPEDERTPEDRVREQQMAQAWWAQYQRRLCLTAGMSQEAKLQRIAREVREPGRGRQTPQEATTQEPAGTIYIGNARSHIYHAPGDPHYGEVRPQNQVRFTSRAEAEAAGYRAAVNQHYGPGAHAAMEATAKELAAKAQRLQVYADELDQVRKGKKVPPSQMVALLAGRELEEAAGRGLTMHLYDKERGGWNR